MSQTHDRSRTYPRHRRLTAAIEDVPRHDLEQGVEPSTLIVRGAGRDVCSRFILEAINCSNMRLHHWAYTMVINWFAFQTGKAG